jgi:hypothetical protein
LHGADNRRAVETLRDTISANDSEEKVVQKFISALVACCALLLSASAIADELSKPKKYDHTTYLTGGVSDEDAAAIKKRGPDFGMQLFLSADHKAVAPGEVKVKILNISGDTVIDAVADGPLFFIKVDGGRYTIILERNGEKKEKTFDLIGRRFGQFSFDWSKEAN